MHSLLLQSGQPACHGHADADSHVVGPRHQTAIQSSKEADMISMAISPKCGAPKWIVKNSETLYHIQL